MTTEEKIARRKLSLLDLAGELGNVSKACKIVGYSRQQFYEIRRNFQTYGAAGLVDRLPGPRNPHPNRVPEEVEKAVLDHALAHPCHGPVRVAHDAPTLGGIVRRPPVRQRFGSPRSGSRSKSRRRPLARDRIDENCLLPAISSKGQNRLGRV